MKNNPNAAAYAFATAFVADIESAPSLKEALVRKRISRNGLIRIVSRDIEAFQRGARGHALFPNVRAVAREFVAQERRQIKATGVSGLGQWDAIASVIGAAAGAAANIYSSVKNTEMQKDLLRLQQQRAQAEMAVAQLQAQAAQTQLAQANAAAGNASANTFSLAPGPLGPSLAGIPILPVVGIAMAVGGYFFFKK